jgi:hypothetical protein
LDHRNFPNIGPQLVRSLLKKIVALGEPRRLTPNGPSNDIRLPGDVNRNPVSKSLRAPGAGGPSLPIAAG